MADTGEPGGSVLESERLVAWFCAAVGATQADVDSATSMAPGLHDSAPHHTLGPEGDLRRAGAIVVLAGTIGAGAVGGILTSDRSEPSSTGGPQVVAVAPAVVPSPTSESVPPPNETPPPNPTSAVTVPPPVETVAPSPSPENSVEAHACPVVFHDGDFAAWEEELLESGVSLDDVDPEDFTALCDQLFATMGISIDQVDTRAKPDIVYEGARTVSAGPQKGAKQLYKFIQDQWDSSRSNAYGIYNPESTIRPGVPSLHAEGRALDVGFNANNPAEKARGDQLFAWAIENARELGISQVIWNKQQWTSNKDGVRPYSGVSAHTDHVHISLTWPAAKGEMPAYMWGILNLRTGGTR